MRGFTAALAMALALGITWLAPAAAATSSSNAASKHGLSMADLSNWARTDAPLSGGPPPPPPLPRAACCLLVCRCA